MNEHVAEPFRSIVNQFYKGGNMKTNQEKQEKIDALVSNLVDVCCSDTSFLVSVIRNGFKGYEEMTDSEIDAEYADYISNEEFSQ